MQVRKLKDYAYVWWKFSPNHNCLDKCLLLLQWDNNETNNFDNAFLVDPNPIEKEQILDMKLSLNAMSSINVSGTMRFTGEVGG